MTDKRKKRGRATVRPKRRRRSWKGWDPASLINGIYTGLTHEVSTALRREEGR